MLMRDASVFQELSKMTDMLIGIGLIMILDIMVEMG